jgi:hypothetical protein
MKSLHPLEIGFDSMCTKSIFGAKELLNNVREGPSAIEISVDKPLIILIIMIN